MKPTKYGSRSSENKNKRHFFRWEKGPGVGTGTCQHCGTKMKMVEDGPRGGLERAYAKKGSNKFEVGKEPACITRSAEHQVSAGKSPAKKSGSTAKKGSKKAAKKNGKAGKAGAKKGGTRAKTAARKTPKKAAPTPTSVASAESEASTTES